MNGTPKKNGSSKSSLYDRAVRYIMDTDASPDHSPDDIHLLGVTHEGYRDTGNPQELSWPEHFSVDFRSRIWCTYRRDFVEPIRDGTAKGYTSDAGWGCMVRTGQSLLANTLSTIHVGRDWRSPLQPRTSSSSFFTHSPNSSPKSTTRRKASISSSPPTPFTSAPTFNTPEEQARYAKYVRLLTWFLDIPEAPFSVHRLCFAGRDLGTEVGKWFGPAIAAGSIQALVQAFPACGLGVSLATDGVLFQSAVFGASHSSTPDTDDDVPLGWGDRPVLLLLGLRLGIDNVHPIYYSTIEELFAFPQSMGIAGGRPSSSYYFVGAQGDGLFYLDPHHSRPALPLRPPPPGTTELTDDYYSALYSTLELQTYHCDKIRKMPINALDPSMLIGFLVRDITEWKDFRRRVENLPQAIFSVQDERPLWPSVDLGGDEDDDLLALESLPSSGSEEAHPSSQVLTPRAVNSALELATYADDPQSSVSPLTQSPIDNPQTPARVDSEDSARSSSGNKSRLSFLNRIRAFGRSRTSLTLSNDGDGK
ncbi:Cysteine protease [Mycena kentingensis (nom. inval.)]|nr:Cysteine protease [Mycena kentingensis (nom. inval.)]